MRWRLSGVPMLVLGFAACGGSDFDGTWTGSLSLSGTCDSGSLPLGSSSGDIAIDARGNELTITYLPCDTSVRADATGDMAILRESICKTAGTGSPARETLRVTGGTLTLSGDKNQLAVAINELTTNPQATGNCSVVNTGTMTRKE